MLNYIDYLSEASRYYELLDEDEFNEIVKRFNDISIDYSDFEFSDDNLEHYIVRKLLLEKFGDYFWVEEIDNNDIVIQHDFLETPDILDDVKEFLESFGYIFVNYDSLKEELLAEAEANEKEKLYQKARLLINDFSSDELKAFIEEYAN